MGASFAEFKELVLTHAVERSPKSALIFEVQRIHREQPEKAPPQTALSQGDDSARIVEFMLNSYFRHFNLYRYIFSRKLNMTLVQTSIHTVESPPPARPLAEAVPH